MVQHLRSLSRLGWISMLVLLVTILAFGVSGSLLVFVLPFGFLFLLLLYYDWKNAYWLLLVLIPLSVHVELVPDRLSSSFPDEPMMWLFFTGTVVLLLAKWRQLDRTWLEHPVTFIVVLQFLWTAISVIYSQMLLVSFKFLLAKSWFIACFFILPILIFRRKRDFRIGFVLMLLPILGSMIVIVARQLFLDFSFRDIEKAVGDLYYNHVEYAAVISAFLPLVVIAFFVQKSRTTMRWAYLVITLFFLLATFFTYARAAVLGLAFAGVVAWMVVRRRAHYVMPLFYAAALLVLALLIHNRNYMKLRPDFEQTYMRQDYAEHMSATFKGQDVSSMERLYRWIAAIRMSIEHPVTGFGPNTFYHFYKPYALNTFQTYSSVNAEHSTTHNYFLYMLAEQGYPAMILYALLVAIVIVQAQQIYHRFQDRFYKLCTLGLVMMFAVNFTTNFFSELIETHKVGAFFYLNLSLLVILDRKSRQEVPDEGSS